MTSYIEAVNEVWECLKGLQKDQHLALTRTSVFFRRQFFHHSDLPVASQVASC